MTDHSQNGRIDRGSEGGVHDAGKRDRYQQLVDAGQITPAVIPGRIYLPKTQKLAVTSAEILAERGDRY